MRDGRTDLDVWHREHEPRSRTDTTLRVFIEISICLEENFSWGHKIHFYQNSVVQRNRYFILCTTDLDLLARLIYSLLRVKTNKPATEPI